MALADFIFGPRLERRLVEQGLPTWTGGLLAELLGEAGLPALMGKDDIFGMSDVRGLLQWGDQMGVSPDILQILGQILPTFGDEQKRQAQRQNMPVFYKNWMQGNFPAAPEVPQPPAPPPGAGPRPPVEPQNPESPGRANRRPRQSAMSAPAGFAQAVTARPSQASIVSQGPPLPPRPGMPPVASQSGSPGGQFGGKNDGGQRQPIRPPRRFY